MATAGGEIAAFTDQVRDELSNVIGDVDILGKAVDDLVDLRQGRAALESQVDGQRRLEQGAQGPYCLHVFFKQVRGTSGSRTRVLQRFQLVILAEGE